MKFWQVFLIAVAASILTNAVGGCVSNSWNQYREFKKFQQLQLLQEQQTHQKGEGDQNRGGDQNRPFDGGRDNVAEYVAAFIPPTATRADVEEIAAAFNNVADRIEDGTLTGREDTTADLNRELQAATDRDVWGPFFVGLYPLISLTASDLRATGDKIKNAVKEPILKAVSALCDAVDEKPTEEPPKAEEPPETTPEEPETVPEPEPEEKPEEPAKATQKKNNYYYRPFPLIPAPPIWRF